MTRFKVTLVKPYVGTSSGLAAPDWVIAALAGEGIEFVGHDCLNREQLSRYAGDSDVVWIFGDDHVVVADNLDVLTACGAILNTGSGTDNIPVAEATELGIIVANTPGATSEAVSDHTIALLLAVKRTVVVQDRALRSGRWNRHFVWPGPTLRGQTLGLIGFGNIGRLVARKLSGFEMPTLVCDPYVSQETFASYGVVSVELDDLLTRADFVSLHCPLSLETHNLIGERELKLMKPTAILVNTSRGQVLDESALFRALSEGWILGAGIDVFCTEETTIGVGNSIGNPFLDLENVVVTPHIGGFSDEDLETFWRESLQVVLDLANGIWPRSIVNPGLRPRFNHLQDTR